MMSIILAGRGGGRLYPATLAVSKQNLSVYDKPMIYDAPGALMLAGNRDILIISTPEDLPRFEAILGDGGAYGIPLQYYEHAPPNMLAEAFIIGRHFIGDDSVALILGDKFFYGAGSVELLRQSAARGDGATVFAWAGAARTGLGRTYHLTGWGLPSWRGLASDVTANRRGLGLHIADARPIATVDWQSPVPRPRNSALDSGKFAVDFSFPMPDWRGSVASVVERLAESLVARS